MQYELARRSPAEDGWLDLQREEAQLLADNRKRWAPPPETGVERWEIRGGLMVVRLSATSFLAHGAALLDAGANVFSIGEIARAGPAFFEAEALARVRALELHAQALGPAGAATIARAPRLSQVRSLSLVDNGLDAQAFSAIAGRLRELRSLTLSANPDAGDAGVAALASPDASPALRALRLRSVGLGPEGVASLAASHLTTRMRRLDLSRNAIGDAGVRAIASATWPALEELDLGENDLGAAAVDSLAASSGLRALRVLSLHSKNEYEAPEPPSIEPLADAPGLEALRVVRVSEYWGSRAAHGRVRGRARELVREVESYGNE